MRASVSARLIASASVNDPRARAVAAAYAGGLSLVERSEVGGPASAFTEISDLVREVSDAGVGDSDNAGGECSSVGVERRSGGASSILFSLVAEGSGVGMRAGWMFVLSGVEVGNGVGSSNACAGLALVIGSGVRSEIAAGVDSAGVALGSLAACSAVFSFSSSAFGFSASLAGGEDFAVASARERFGGGGGFCSAFSRLATKSFRTFLFAGCRTRVH